MEKSIIVAVADNWAIGKDNALLWHISEDMKFFRRTTVGCPVIMGRRTWESIGRPLPKRLNIVVSRGFEAPEGVVVCKTLAEAYEAAQTQDSERMFIMGGGRIYSSAIDDADSLYVTHVHTVIEGADTFFPQIDPREWTVQSRSEMMTDPETGYDFEFVVYSRWKEKISAAGRG